MRPMTRTTWSIRLPRFTAASTPSGTPTTTPISVPQSRELDRRREDAAMSVITGLVVSTELPKSPVSALSQ